MKLLTLALLVLGPGNIDAGDKPPVAQTSPDIGKAWEKRIPQLSSDNLPLDEVVKLLRQEFPELNFIVKQKARSESVSVMLRLVTLEEILKAIDPATEGRVRVIWPTNEFDRMIIFDRTERAVSVDSTTGLPFPATGKKVCRVFNLSEYLSHFPENEVDGAIKEIRGVLETAWTMLRQANEEADEPAPSLSVHRGTKLLVAVGRPEDLQILEQVVIGLQGSAPNTTVETTIESGHEKRPKPATGDAARAPSKK